MGKLEKILGVASVAILAIAIAKQKKQNAESVGKLKRRIYAEMEALQKAGLLFDVRWNELSPDEKRKFEEYAKYFGYRIGAKSTKTLGESYYNNIRREYNKIAGIGATRIPYTKHEITDFKGDVVLEVRDYGGQDGVLEKAIAEYDRDYIKDMYDAYWATLSYLAQGGKFVWSDKKNYGVQEELFGGEPHPEERKARISILAKKEKGGLTPNGFAHILWQRNENNADDLTIKNGVLEALSKVYTKKQAQKEVFDRYLQDNQIYEYDDEDYKAPF